MVETCAAMIPSTLGQMFLESVRRFNRPDRLKYKSLGHTRSISDAELDERVRQTRLGLLAMGLERGDRVAILAYNRPEWLIADYAILTAGAVTVPLYSTLPAESCREILEHSGARMLILSDREQWAKVEGLRSRLPHLQHVISMDRVNADVMTMEDLAALGAKQSSVGATRRVREVAASDLATIIYTSGTTGTPKGVMLTHKNLMSNVQATMEALRVTERDSTLSFLPLSHSFERIVDYVMFHAGATIAYPDSLDTVANDIIEAGPTVICAVPRFYEKIHQAILHEVTHAGSQKQDMFNWALRVGRMTLIYRLHSRPIPLWLKLKLSVASRIVLSKILQRLGGRVRVMVSGGAPLSPALVKFFFSAGFTLLEGYGLTEASPVVAVNTEDAVRIGTVGRPLRDVEVRFAPDGEILVRGPNVMTGYYNDPEETARTIHDGWLLTGDIGELDDGGFLKITDRKKELIKTSGGKYIAPQMIENKLKESPYVSNAVVIGDRRPYATALLVPNMAALQDYAQENGILSRILDHPDIQSLFQREIDRVNSTLASYETIKKFALLKHEPSVENGELTPTMKIRRRMVEEHYRLMIDSLYLTP